jgi:uncharacterized membrane protein
MNGETSMPNEIRLALATIIVHAVVVSLHAAAHQILGVQASLVQLIYIVLVIMVAPLAAGLLLWKGLKTEGAALLVCSLMGSLIFGVFNHFVMNTPDHVSHVGELPQKSWALVFQITAALLALVEAFGIWAGMRALNKV